MEQTSTVSNVGKNIYALYWKDVTELVYRIYAIYACYMNDYQLFIIVLCSYINQ